MCDTLVALGNSTADGATLFGKNSDREPNEAHELLYIPAAHHKPGSMVKCTYIEIPQVEQTFTVLLAKPFWMWGAEMGTNEHGLTIGNEAVFTKVPYEKEGGLLGMDLLRLALERCKTAEDALHLLTGLLEEHGQGGNAGYEHKLFYHNSFILADPSEAWVLETAGHQWAASKVKEIRTISNIITIENEWDLASDDLVSYAVERGWCKGRDDFNFTRNYSDFLYTTYGFGYERHCRTTNLLQAKKGKLTPQDVTAVLRDHGEHAGENWSPDRKLMGMTVCAHAGWGPFRGSQSVGSMVSHLASDVQTHFVTGTSAPCTSVFKPVWVEEVKSPDFGPAPTAKYDEAARFWQHEALHRSLLRDYATLMPEFKERRDALENQFIENALALSKAGVEKRSEFSARCFLEADVAEAEWYDEIKSKSIQDKNDWIYASAWKSFNRGIGFTQK